MLVCAHILVLMPIIVMPVIMIIIIVIIMKIRMFIAVSLMSVVLHIDVFFTVVIATTSTAMTTTTTSISLKKYLSTNMTASIDTHIRLIIVMIVILKS